MRDVGQNMFEHPRHLRGADRFGRAHIFAHRMLDELGPDQAVDAGPAGQPQDHHHRQHAAAENHREGEDQQDAGDGGEDVVEPFQQVADAAAEKARQRAEHGADDGGDYRRQQADHDRDFSPFDRLGQHIAAEPVAAERQGLGLHRIDGLELGRAFVPFLVSRCQRVDVAEVDIRAFRHSDRPGCLGWCRTEQRRRRIRHADFALPVLGQQAAARGDYQQQEQADDDHRADAHPVAAHAAPAGRPDTFGSVVGPASDFVHLRAHFSTTLGSTSL